VSAPVTITLRQPIERRSASTGQVVDSVAELVLRPLKLGDLVAAMDAAADAGKGTMTLHLAARCCGVTAAEMADLGIEDGMEVMDAVAGFIPAGLRTGTAGST
jgi:hypothetical protein